MPEAIVKRPRGRPRKNPLPAQPEVPVVKRPRGRPRKNPLPPKQEVVAVPAAAPVSSVNAPVVKNKPVAKVKLDYCVISNDDLEMWIEYTGRQMFIDASRDFVKMKKSKIVPEIRWYKDAIKVVPASQKPG